MACTHCLTPSVLEVELKWIIAALQCEELPKEQSYVKYHFIIPTVEAITEMAVEECS